MLGADKVMAHILLRAGYHTSQPPADADFRSLGNVTRIAELLRSRYDNSNVFLW